MLPTGVCAHLRWYLTRSLHDAPRGLGLVDHDGGGPGLLEPLPLETRHRALKWWELSGRSLDIDNPLYCPSVSKSLVCQYLGSFVLYPEITEAEGGLTSNVSQYFHYNFFDRNWNLGASSADLVNDFTCIVMSLSAMPAIWMLFCVCRQVTREYGT